MPWWPSERFPAPARETRRCSAGPSTRTVGSSSCTARPPCAGLTLRRRSSLRTWLYRVATTRCPERSRFGSGAAGWTMGGSAASSGPSECGAASLDSERQPPPDRCRPRRRRNRSRTWRRAVVALDDGRRPPAQGHGLASYACDVSEPDTSAAREDEPPAFRSAAHALVDGVADHLAALPSRPVWQPLPDALRKQLLDLPLPEHPAAMDDLVATAYLNWVPASSAAAGSGCVRSVSDSLRGCPGLSGSATWWSVT
jgi:hypothetical protein